MPSQCSVEPCVPVTEPTRRDVWNSMCAIFQQMQKIQDSLAFVKQLKLKCDLRK